MLNRNQLEVIMEEAVEKSIEHVDHGGLPFVGVIVNDQGVLSEFSFNRVQETGDPQAHAEVEAVRDALSSLGLKTLSGTTLLATGEPCGMCFRFALDHEVDQVYVAINGETTARYGFDGSTSYAPFDLNLEHLYATGYAHSLPVDRGEEPFIRYTQMREHRGQ